MIVEVVGGVLTGSLALLADAAHMLTDAAAIGLAFFAMWISGRPALAGSTFGLVPHGGAGGPCQHGQLVAHRRLDLL